VSTVPNIVVISHRPSIMKSMKRLQAYKFKIEPNCEQIRNMRQFAGNEQLAS